MSQRHKTKRLIAEIEKQTGRKAYDIEFLDGYFIFEHGKDMVCHFRLKGCKGWKFGIWWDLENHNLYDFFAQYESLIDKFKPSASTFVIEDVAYGRKDTSVHVKGCVAPIVNFIHRHRYLAFAIELKGYYIPWETPTAFEAWKEYLSYKWKYEIKAPFLKKRLTKRYKKLCGLILDETCKDWYYASKIDCFVVSDINNEGLSKGHYSIEFGELPLKLFNKCVKFQNKIRHFENKYGFLDFTFDGYIDVFVKPKTS